MLATHFASVNLDDGGRFDLILYGMENSQDLESVALMVRRESGYRLEAVTPTRIAAVMRDISASEAKDAGTDFLRKSTVLNTVATRRIIGPKGEDLGYELRPVYHEFQVPNRFYRISYFLEEPGVVRFRVSWDNYNDPFGIDD